MVGATGRFGHLVLDELVARGVWVRALVRDAQRAAIARRRGAHDAVVADLTRPETLGPALTGIDGVFHIGPGLHPREAEMGTALVAAACAAQVRRFVFSGVIHPSISALSNHTAKLPVEEALYSSGMNFTVLQPARFMQMLQDYWRADRDELALPYSVASVMSWVDYRDVAEVAAIGLTSDQLDYGTFELSSPGRFDGAAMAAICAEALDRHVAAVQIPASDYALRLPEQSRGAFLRMMTHYDRAGLPAGNGRVLENLLGRHPRTVEAFLRELVGTSSPRQESHVTERKS